MRRARTITVSIDYPCEATYRFLSDPRNYGEWAAVEKNTYRQLSNGDWAAQVTFGGMRHFRFTPVNAFGVLGFLWFVVGLWWLIDALLIPGIAAGSNNRIADRVFSSRR